MRFNKILAILLIFVLLFLSLSIVSASENVTDVPLESDEVIADEIAESDDDSQDDSIDVKCNDSGDKTDTNVEVDSLDSYYTKKTDLTGYLKDFNGTPLKNKKLVINVVGKNYNVSTNEEGMFKLPINLRANTYKVLIRFAGDDIYEASNASTFIKISKLPISIKANNFVTYVGSDIFFTVTAYNELTKNPAAGVKLLFKVYSSKTKKYTNYYAITDKNGVATLNKNLAVGDYAVYVSADDKRDFSSESTQDKTTVKILPTAEMGCCSFYIQVSNSEAVCGFRRDSTYAADILIISQSWWGRPVIKQYKNTNSYSFHLIITADGWMIGTGGADNPTVNRNIEKLAAKMVSDGYLQRPLLNKIQSYIRYLGIGHFVIKTPYGRYAAVWKDGMVLNVLKPGQFISVPNRKTYFRQGNFAKYGAHPASAGIKIGATDKYGVNRRDIIVYHWRATNNDFKTTSLVKVYGTNDNGKLVGRSSAYLKDNIKFKNVFHSKNSLPYPIRGKVLGIHNFGNIDKFVKIPTVVSAPKVTNKLGKSALFKVTVKDKVKKPVANVYIYVKITASKFSKVYRLKTDSNGLAKIDTKQLKLGKYNVLISQANNKYWSTGTSSIDIVK